jgi:hypothetical protein
MAGTSPAMTKILEFTCYGKAVATHSRLMVRRRSCAVSNHEMIARAFSSFETPGGLLRMRT